MTFSSNFVTAHKRKKKRNKKEIEWSLKKNSKIRYSLWLSSRRCFCDFWKCRTKESTGIKYKQPFENRSISLLGFKWKLTRGPAGARSDIRDIRMCKVAAKRIYSNIKFVIQNFVGTLFVNKNGWRFPPRIWSWKSPRRIIMSIKYIKGISNVSEYSLVWKKKKKKNKRRESFDAGSRLNMISISPNWVKVWGGVKRTDRTQWQRTASSYFLHPRVL